MGDLQTFIHVFITGTVKTNNFKVTFTFFVEFNPEVYVTPARQMTDKLDCSLAQLAALA